MLTLETRTTDPALSFHIQHYLDASQDRLIADTGNRRSTYKTKKMNTDLWTSIEALSKIPTSQCVNSFPVSKKQLWLAIEALGKIAKILPIESASESVEQAINALIPATRAKS